MLTDNCPVIIVGWDGTLLSCDCCPVLWLLRLVWFGDGACQLWRWSLQAKEGKGQGGAQRQGFTRDFYFSDAHVVMGCHAEVQSVVPSRLTCTRRGSESRLDVTILYYYTEAVRSRRWGSIVSRFVVVSAV